jgi:hypothetical protein
MPYLHDVVVVRLEKPMNQEIKPEITLLVIPRNRCYLRLGDSGKYIFGFKELFAINNMPKIFD